MERRRVFALAAALVAVLGAACGGSSPTTPSPVSEAMTTQSGSAVSPTTTEALDGALAMSGLPAVGLLASRDDRVWWASLSAAARGQLIVSASRSYVGSSQFAERCNCKEAVRRWAREASRDVVTIPATSGNNYEWASSPQIVLVTNSRTARVNNGASTFSRISPGDMVQMSLPFRPYLHTLVVERLTGDGFTAVEANWKACAVTAGRAITFADLLNTGKVLNFSVYRAVSNLS